MDFTQRQAILRTIQHRENRLLSLKQIIGVRPWHHKVRAPEAHGHAVSALLDLGARQPG